jgi:thiamine kinase
VLFSNNKLTRDELLSRFFPRYHPVASLSQNGLSGGSVIISDGDQRHVLRQPHDPVAPFIFAVSIALCRLPARLAPPRCFTHPAGWWWSIAREVKSELPACPQLSGLLYDLHQQPRLGWRVSLGRCWQYWQRCDPARRTPRGCAGISGCAAGASLVLCGWRRCIWMSMPAILSIASRPEADRLGICRRWRYRAGAGRGVDRAGERRQLVAAYARRAAIDAQLLWRQVVRWRPWVLLLMAGWYEMRWRQSGDRQFITLADETWCQLDNERKG